MCVFSRHAIQLHAELCEVHLELLQRVVPQPVHNRPVRQHNVRLELDVGVERRMPRSNGEVKRGQPFRAYAFDEEDMEHKSKPAFKPQHMTNTSEYLKAFPRPRDHGNAPLAITR